ncbi:MAG TPA: hypothetical protein VEP50_20375 [bacterium]|nr:hypothetical protein [bacterium]
MVEARTKETATALRARALAAQQRFSEVKRAEPSVARAGDGAAADADPALSHGEAPAEGDATRPSGAQRAVAARLEAADGLLAKVEATVDRLEQALQDAGAAKDIASLAREHMAAVRLLLEVEGRLRPAPAVLDAAVDEPVTTAW